MNRRHLRKPTKPDTAACGKPTYLYPDLDLTDAPGSVTCGRCRATHLYQNLSRKTVIAALDQMRQRRGKP